MKTATLLLLASPVLAEQATSTFTFEDEDHNVSGSDSTYTTEDGTRVHEMRRKFKDYFYYAFSAKEVSNELTIAECSTSQECDDSGAT